MSARRAQSVSPVSAIIFYSPRGYLPGARDPDRIPGHRYVALAGKTLQCEDVLAGVKKAGRHYEGQCLRLGWQDPALAPEDAAIGIHEGCAVVANLRVIPFHREHNPV